MRKLVLLTTLLALHGPALLAAPEQNPAEAKLRESLRNTMLQVRTLQGEKDTLQAAKDQADAEKKAVDDKLKALVKETAASQAAAEKSLTETRDQLALQQQENQQLKENLEKWKTAHKQVSELAEKREAARVKLNSEKIELQRKVADQQRKNAEMFKVGNEVLARYENFGLGTALTAREPFVGITRVKLQNLVQDYSDKLADQRIKPDAAPAHPIAAKP